MSRFISNYPREVEGRYSYIISRSLPWTMNVTAKPQPEATAKLSTPARPKILDLLAIEEFSIDCLCGVY